MRQLFKEEPCQHLLEREFEKANDSDELLPNEILPDYLDETSEDKNECSESKDDEGNQVAMEEVAKPELGEYKELETESGVLVGTVRVLAEDCGGNLALPHYGFSRPSSDYYNSNLMLHSFIQCDMASGINHISL